MKKKIGRIKVPEGKSIAVNFGFDFDTDSVWYSLGDKTEAAMPRGEFGAEVGYHGYAHESVGGLSADGEEKLIYYLK